mgnify:CR=1 FL=1
MAEKTIKELDKLWKQEKEEYKTAEIGTGVQKFVKHVFESKELFNLEEGKLSTADLKRQNEFLTEAKKKGRRADVVIFIDSDVIIPVEVEKHGNIKAGIHQIYNYQSDWIKKYGLLTDGNEWWFYNNRFVEKKFFIKDILENPTDFLTYWKEYTTADYYYRSFFEKKGQLELFEEPPPPLDNVREDFFIDITNLIENFENKLNLKGYFKKEKDETERKKKAVEITYAYLIQFILYKVLVDNAFSDFEEDWKDRIKSIDKSIRAESYNGVLASIKGISKKISDNIYKRFNDEQASINEKLDEILNQPKQDIGDVSAWLDILLFINRYNFANVQNEIFGYVYENYLKDLYLDEKKGQYFTDPNVVEFMLNEMGYTRDNLQKHYGKNKDSLSIIDPSCGSGTFLYNATNRLVETFFDESNKSAKLTEQLINENIFGFDIAEFPLYLAEMNILMRMLPIIINERYNNPIEQKIKVFKTRDSIAEFLDTEIKNTIADMATAFKKGKIQFDLFTQAIDLDHSSFMRDKGDLDDLKTSLEDKNKKPRIRFDFVVGNPPYVSYNECAKQKLLIIQLIQGGKINMGDIYGMNLNSIPSKLKTYPPKPNLYAFFIALGIGLLKNDGIISYIIPQTILTANDLDVLRYHLSNFLTIEKIITFSGNMFIGRGIKQNRPVPTSSLIFIIRKTPPTKLHQVEIVNYIQKEDVPFYTKDLQDSKKWDKVIKKQLLQNNLRQNSDNWNYLIQTPEVLEVLWEYNKKSDSFDTYRLFEFSVPTYKAKFYFDVGFILDDKNILSEDDGNCYEILDFKTFYGYSSFFPTKFYPKNKDLIALTRSNQGHITLEPKWNLVWRIKNTTGFKLTDHPIIFNMGTASIITSDNKEEMHYLLSILNSPVSKFILETFLKIPTEKEYLLAILPIKKYIRVPKINPYNEHIKNEIIESTYKLLDIEKTIFSDLINFKEIMLQKFDSADVIGNILFIRYKDKEAKCKITQNPDLVKTVVSNLKKLDLFNEDGIGSISELKSLSAFDKEYQSQYKSYIDDLVYSLYFKVKLPELGFENAQEIKKACAKNKYYQLINSK